MKKILTLTAALLAVTVCQSVTLSPEEALNRALYSEAAPRAVKSISSASPKLVMTGKSENGDPAYYVFTDKSGTLFVSADDVAVPLLGYTDTGNLDESSLPPQLTFMLNDYAREIEWAKTSGYRLMEGAENAGSGSVKTVNGGRIDPLLKTTWDQGSPYNKYCPKLGNTATVTGCVATSMAQVMNYYKWPEAQVPAMSYYWENGRQTLSGSAVTIDWGNMLDSYSGGYNTTQADAVARLMQVCGYSVEMKYNTSANGGSGAYSMNIRGALVDKFGYDVATTYLLRDYYSAEEWAQMIYDNLTDYGPVVYGGKGSAGGHSFVCDGYDGNGKFHFNWGWSGTSDGYFVLSALNPSALGTGGGAGGFNSNQDAVLKISKPKSGSVPPEACLCSDGDIGASINGRTLKFSCMVYNAGPIAGEFRVGVELMNISTGTSNYYYMDSNYYGIDLGYGFDGYSVSLPSNLANGTYKATPVYLLRGKSPKPILFPYGCEDYAMLNVNSSGITIGPAGEVTVDSYNITKGFVSGGDYEFTVKLSNTYATDKQESLDAYICVLSGNNFSIKSRLGNQTVTIPAFSSAEMKFAGTLDQLTPGNYYLVFAHDSTVVTYYEVEVTVQGEIKIISYEVNPDPLQPGRESTVVTKFNNTYNSEKSIDLELFLCLLNGNTYNPVDTYGLKTCVLAANADTDITYQTKLTAGLPDGTYYLVWVHNENEVFAHAEVEVKSTGEFNVETWNSTTGFVSEKEYEVDVTIGSTYAEALSSTFDAYLCKEIDNNLKIFAELGSTTIELPADGSAVATYSGTLPELEEGDDYYFVIAQDLKSIWYVQVEVTVEEEPVITGEITLESFTSEPEEPTAGESSVIKAVFSNTYPEDRTIDVTLDLCRMEGDEYIVVAPYSSNRITIPASSEITSLYTTVLPETLENGIYYLRWVDDETQEVMFAGEISIRGTSGVAFGEAADGEVRYFNLQGFEIKNDRLEPGIYLRVGKKSVTRIIIK